jgi:hypothetical protein
MTNPWFGGGGGEERMDEREAGLQPLDDDATGCMLAFVPSSPPYQYFSALAVLAGLYPRKFSGVCECYIRPGLHGGKYLMGVGLGFDGDTPDDRWWGAFVDNVRDACTDDEDIRLDRVACEVATVGELRAAMLHAGTAGFEAGVAVWVSDPAGPDPDSPFTVLCRNVCYEGS